jgi:hypothetical protein
LVVAIWWRQLGRSNFLHKFVFYFSWRQIDTSFVSLLASNCYETSLIGVLAASRLRFGSILVILGVVLVVLTSFWQFWHHSGIILFWRRRLFAYMFGSIALESLYHFVVAMFLC